MKNRIFVMIILLCMLLCGCQVKSDALQEPVTVYYRLANISYGTIDSVIAPTDMESAGHTGDYTYLLNLYLTNDTSEEFARTFPKATMLVSIKMDALTAKVVLSDSFATLTGIDLTIACACLTQTVISLTGCQEVIISTKTQKLDGQNFITLSKDSFLFLDESSNIEQ